MPALPAVVEVFPGLVVPVIARRYSDGGRGYTPALALALWHLARALDTTGAGRLPLAELQAAGLELWSKAQLYRALRIAQELGLVEVAGGRAAGRVVYLRGLARVAEILECSNVGACKVAVPTESLKSAKSFKAALFNAWHAGRSRNTGRPISRATIQELTGLGKRTQRRYERATRTTKPTPNATTVAPTPDALRGARDHVHGACYTLPDGRVVRPLPNSYTSTLARASRSKCQKVNRRARQALVTTPAGQLSRRMFFDHADAAERAMRQGKASDVTYTPMRASAAGPALWARVVDSWTLSQAIGA